MATGDRVADLLRALPPRVALVHDYLNQYGGAERVLEQLHELFPTAPIYTSMYDPAAMPGFYRRWDIRTSFMQRLPWVVRRHRSYLPLYPHAFESFDLSAYDLVISNSSAFCKGIITGPDTVHVCYCLTPMRWVWRYREYVGRERLGRVARAVLPPFIHYLRLWDVVSAQRVDRFVGISRAVAARIEKYYGRPAEVVYPPVDTASIVPSRAALRGERLPGDYYLTVGRLIPYRRLDLIVDVFNRLGTRVRIVGDGRDRHRLMANARPNVEFLGRVGDEELAALYAGCRAFLWPAEEDFGIAPVEAQAAGRPVIAYAAGGALDTVLPGETGVLFDRQTPEALTQAVRLFERSSFDVDVIRANAERFSTEMFRERLLSELVTAWEQRRLPTGPPRLSAPHWA